MACDLLMGKLYQKHNKLFRDIYLHVFDALFLRVIILGGFGSDELSWWRYHKQVVCCTSGVCDVT